jgi:hypothetical protein
MTHVIALVHGMGVHGKNWSGTAVAALKAAARTYKLDKQLSDSVTSNKVAIVPVSYDDRFTAHVNQWGKDSRQLAKFITHNAIDVPTNLVSWLENADETENNFIWSHVVDVILYRFFNQVTTDVQVHVMDQIASIWEQALQEDIDAQFTIVAHSLGTSVVHDSLAKLATDPPPNAAGFLAGDARLASLFMVANVSRVLETHPTVYDSCIAPPSVRGSKAYCARMWNVRHWLDPFPAPRPFKPAWGGGDFTQVETRAVREFNTHDFDRYLDDPRLHIPILQSAFGDSAVANADAAIRKYDEAPGPSCAQALAEFVQDCTQRIELIRDTDDVKTLLAAGVHFLNDVDEVRTKCANET